MQSLPNFDQLVHLAATDPQQFTLLRQRLIEQTINQASPAMQPRLRAQQSHIDRVISHAKNPSIPTFCYNKSYYVNYSVSAKYSNHNHRNNRQKYCH